MISAFLFSSFFAKRAAKMSGSLLRMLMELFAIGHVVNLCAFFGVPMLVTFCFLWFTSYWYISLLYLAWYLYDRQTPFRAGRPIAFIRNLLIWKYAARHFPITLHKTAELDPTKNYIFGVHPHGIYVFGASLTLAANGVDFDKQFPGITPHLLILNGHFKFPCYREYLIAIGLGSADSDSIDYKLSHLGPGHSAVLVIGGAAEMWHFDQTVYKIKVNSRKGFIRKALINGASVVPVFIFNEIRALDISYSKKGTWSYYLEQAVLRVFNIHLPALTYGFGGIPLLLGGPPKKVPINTVIGAPIDFNELKGFTKGQKPPEELVEECHMMYLNALRELYDKHKSRFGDDNTPLIFV